MSEGELDQLLAEQQRYYRQRASRYLDTGLVAVSEAHGRELEQELGEALDAHFGGDVLELACGPGTWTPMLVARARSVTAVDGAPEMLAIAARRAAGSNVRFVQADLFRWRPDHRYDAVFFGFWLSHVPADRFEGFWDQVARSLLPGGHVAFVDDAYRTSEELIYGRESEVIQRTLEDGSRHRIVKSPRTAADLKTALAELGWQFAMHEAGPFFWGLGTR
jgi:ubiquinone/menaquinone biosynthesis C-methylase UbiE